MSFSFRFGRRALGVGIFYHAQKRILYVHPLPFVAVLVHLCRHKWGYPHMLGLGMEEEQCVQCGLSRTRSYIGDGKWAGWKAEET